MDFKKALDGIDDRIFVNKPQQLLLYFIVLSKYTTIQDPALYKTMCYFIAIHFLKMYCFCSSPLETEYF